MTSLSKNSQTHFPAPSHIGILNSLKFKSLARKVKDVMLESLFQSYDLVEKPDKPATDTTFETSDKNQQELKRTLSLNLSMVWIFTRVSS